MLRSLNCVFRQQLSNNLLNEFGGTYSLRLLNLSRNVPLRSVTSEAGNRNPVPDKLYRMVEVECRAHDNAVLRSYEIFATTAAKELNITVHNVWEPWRHITRRTLLASIFVNKKCREQYEWRTYFRILQFKYLTGSTADTFLEYIQRNLPEGVAMRVSRFEIEALPEHLKPPQEAVSSSST
ncbi:28S ribosomal protein S10, mitochondrial [Halotydeus destructor]|nr:28S ribosomal protein S10, mitochondrial [Halotydeus destructor]